MFEKLKIIFKTLTGNRQDFAEYVRSEEFQKAVLGAFSAVFIAYVSASIVSSLTVSVIMDSVFERSGSSSKSRSQDDGTSYKISPLSQPNFRDIQREIVDRNVFNMDGELPEEKDEKEEEAAPVKATFDINAPCVNTKLKLELLGTIYLGQEQASMATIKESGMQESDIYRVGDEIIGQEEVFIAEISRNRVILNNAGAKECLDGKVDLGQMAAFSSPRPPSSQPEVAKESPQAGPVRLQAAWVENELGDGFGKIIASARYVPNSNNDGQFVGFKMFQIQKGSLFDKVGFENGDIVTKVNDTVMTADQGFSLYQSFLDEREISVQVLRKGETPTTLKIEIK